MHRSVCIKISNVNINKHAENLKSEKNPCTFDIAQNLGFSVYSDGFTDITDTRNADP